MEQNGKIVFCKDCHNTIMQTIDNNVVLYCKIRQQFIGFYEVPCGEYN